MFDDKQLWKDRLGETSKELGRYLRYIFNGHLVVVMLFLLGTVAYYYQGWVSTLSPQFPVAIVMTVVLVLFVTYSPTYTFLQQADKIFLLPVETKLTNYFVRSSIVSILFQSYLLLLLLAALMPMYVQVYGGNYQVFFTLFFCLVVLKSFNVTIRRYIFYYIETSVHRIDSVVRFFINGLTLYFLFSRVNIIFVFVMFALLLMLSVYFCRAVKEKGLKWELLIEQEEKRMGSFYRLANLFTDVPKLKEQVKRRKWLDPLLQFISFGHQHTFTHLYVRSLFRSGDYLGLFLRLTVIGGIVIYSITPWIGQLVIGLLFLYLTGFQLMPLRLHHENNLIVQLYPVPQIMKEKVFQRILLRVLFIQVVIFTTVSLIKGDWFTGLIIFLAGSLFIVVFVYFYSKKAFRHKQS